VEHGAPQRQALLPAQRQLSGQSTALILEPGHPENPAGPRFAARPGDPVKPREEPDVFLHGEIGIEREELRHVADVTLDLVALGEHVEAGHRAVALGFFFLSVGILLGLWLSGTEDLPRRLIGWRR